jgi:hypothetical protein
VSAVEIVPIEGQNHEGRQWGWRILKDGEPLFDCTTGGTGDCWNVGEPPELCAGEEPGDKLHICDLDEAIGALRALRDSEAHRQNVEQWS